MSGKKNMLVTLGFVLSVSLIAAAVSALLVSRHCSRLQFDLLNAVCGEVAEQVPEAKKMIAAALKAYTEGIPDDAMEDDVLSELGYHISDFSDFTYEKNVLFVITGFMLGLLLYFFTYSYRNKIETARIWALAEYLEQVNIGKAVILSTSGEDDFSKLEDEI